MCVEQGAGSVSVSVIFMHVYTWSKKERLKQSFKENVSVSAKSFSYWKNFVVALA